MLRFGFLSSLLCLGYVRSRLIHLLCMRLCTLAILIVNKFIQSNILDYLFRMVKFKLLISLHGICMLDLFAAIQ